MASDIGRCIARARRLRPETRTRQIAAAARERARCTEQLRILTAYLAGIAPRRRPRYTPHLRVDILAFKYRHGLSHDQTAHRFLVDPGTVCQWNVRADDDPTPAMLDARLRSRDQARARAVALLVPRIKAALRPRLLAALITLGEDIPPRHRNGHFEARKRAASETTPRSRRSPIVAQHPNHFWMADFTVFTRSGRPDLYLAAFLDVFSRRTLAWRLFEGEPSSEDAAALLREAIDTHGQPRHFVSDQGSQFTGDAFQKTLAGIGCDHRQGAVGEKGSIAIIERFWRTAKDALDVRLCPPLIPDILAERIAAALDWHDRLRPHQSLENATPAEVFAARPLVAAMPAPRGRPGQPTQPLGIAIRFALDGERRLPYLERVA